MKGWTRDDLDAADPADVATILDMMQEEWDAHQEMMNRSAT